LFSFSPFRCLSYYSSTPPPCGDVAYHAHYYSHAARFCHGYAHSSISATGAAIFISRESALRAPDFSISLHAQAMMRAQKMRQYRRRARRFRRHMRRGKDKKKKKKDGCHSSPPRAPPERAECALLTFSSFRHFSMPLMRAQIFCVDAR